MSKKKSDQQQNQKKGCCSLIAKRLITIMIVLVFSMMYYTSSNGTEQQDNMIISIEADEVTKLTKLVYTPTLYLNGKYVDTNSIHYNNGVTEEGSTETVEKDTVNLEPEEEVIEEPEEEEPKYEFESVGYINCRTLNIRKKPSTDSKRLGYYSFNDEVRYSSFNYEWAVIEYEGGLAYICKKYISDTRTEYESKSVSGDSRKSYMDYRAITSTSSMQYQLQYNYAYTESNGVRAVNGRYCIALGSYYTHSVGQYVDLVLENGNIIPAIIGDCKRDIDTVNGCSMGVDGGVAEFVVDTDVLSSRVKQMGDVSYTSDDWMSNVVEIRIYNKNVFE